jgi:sterol desaturase/sphingolipid hydroxylase (fatty acid hydroxylase superfamily)
MATIKNEGSRRIFKSDFLESLTRAHISVPLTLFYGVAMVLMAYEFYKEIIPAWQLIVTFICGIFFWTIFEYFVHRYVFHVGRGASNWRKNLQETIHGVHHEYPRDKGRLALPPVLSVIVSSFFIVVFKLILGDFGFPAVAGFLTGYATYLVVHYSVHAFRPPKNFFRRLWINHSIHHYKDPNTVFGVSSPVWDYVFGTIPKEKF